MPRKSTDEMIGELIGEGVQFKGFLPQRLHAELVNLGERRFGTMKRQILIQKSLVYAAALGVIGWRREYKKSEKK